MSAVWCALCTSTPWLKQYFTFQKVQHKSNFAHVGTKYTYGQLKMHIQRSTFEIQIPLQWNIISCSMPPPQSYCRAVLCHLNLTVLLFPQGYIWRMLQECYNFNFLIFVIAVWNCVTGNCIRQQVSALQIIDNVIPQSFKTLIGNVLKVF